MVECHQHYRFKSVFTKKLPLQLLHLLMTCHELPHHRLLISCRRLQKEKWELERWIEHFILFFITMVPKVNALQASIKTAAVGGIFIVWVNFTKAFKFA